MESFVRWLHRVCIEDSGRKRTYADVYALGPQIESCLGIEGEFNLPRLSVMLREKFPEAVATKHLDTIVVAEAAWRLERAGLAEPDSTPTQCAHTGLDGVQCRNPPAPGAARCIDHGGAVLDPSVRRSMLISSYSKMMDAGDTAVEALVEIAEHSKSALARVYAAREILDRIGLVHEGGAHQADDTDNSAENQDALMAEMREQMATARSRLALQAVPIEDSDSEVVDAELVD